MTRLAKAAWTRKKSGFTAAEPSLVVKASSRVFAVDAVHPDAESLVPVDHEVNNLFQVGFDLLRRVVNDARVSNLHGLDVVDWARLEGVGVGVRYLIVSITAGIIPVHPYGAATSIS